MLRLLCCNVVNTRNDFMAIDFESLDSFDRKRILLVDDDPFILGVLEKLLGLLRLKTIF